MHAKYEVSISYGSKVVVKIKVDNTLTDRQDKNNMPPIYQSGGGGHKHFAFVIRLFYKGMQEYKDKICVYVFGYSLHIHL